MKSKVTSKSSNESSSKTNQSDTTGDELNIVDVDLDEEISEKILDSIKTTLDQNPIIYMSAIKLRKKPVSRRGKKREFLKVIYEIHIMNSKFMAVFNLILGLLCISIGVGIYFVSTNLRYISIPYTDCVDRENKEKCSDVINKDVNSDCVCELNFNLTKEMAENAMVYYEIYPFYQNNRRYMSNKSPRQLLGNRIKNKTLCHPFAFRDGKEIAPCGAFANSIFNDTFTLEKRKMSDTNSSTWTEINIVEDDLVFDDFLLSYQNPDPKDNLTAAFIDTVKPDNWNKRIEEFGGYTWQRLMVWMSPGPFSNVMKLFGRIINDDFGSKLETGIYKLTIGYNYPLWTSNAQKTVKIANTSFLGHRNFKLAFYFTSIGAYLVLTAAVFQLVYLSYDKPTTQVLLKLGIQTTTNRGFTFQASLEDSQ